MGGDRTNPPHPRSRLDGPCYGSPPSAGNAFRHLLVPTDRTLDPRDHPDRSPHRPIPPSGCDPPSHSPVRDPVARSTARTGADHRRMDLQSPRAARPSGHAPPDVLPGGVVSPPLQVPQPHRGYPLRNDHPVANVVPAPARRRAVNRPVGDPLGTRGGRGRRPPPP